MKQISFGFAFISCVVLASLFTVSCTKKNGTLDPQSLSSTSSTPVKETSTTVADPAIAYIATVGSGNKKSTALMVMNTDGSNQTLLFSGSVGLPSWSPDGKHITFTGTINGVGGVFGIVDVSVVNGKVIGSNVRRIPITQPGTANGGRWSPVGDLILFIYEDGNIYTIPTTGGTATIVYTSPVGFYPFDPDWSPDGSKIVFTEWNDAFTQSNLQVMDLATKQLTTVRPFTSTLIASPTWSRHGDRIAYTANGINTVTPTENATPVKVTSGGYQTWSPDDSKLALEGGKPSGIVTYTFNGGATTTLVSGRWPDWRRF